MAEVIPADFISELHGKTSSTSNGYFYMSKKTGKMYFRSREEGYQKNQSPRQKWNSAAFKAANTQLKQILNNPEAKARLLRDYESAGHIASNGKSYSTLRAWIFNSLIYDYKQAHPFE